MKNYEIYIIYEYFLSKKVSQTSKCKFKNNYTSGTKNIQKSVFNDIFQK